MKAEEREILKENLKKQVDELSDEELEKVVGGRITYAPFWNYLKRNGITKSYLISRGIVTPTELTRMQTNHKLNMNFVNRICEALGCDVSDVIAEVDD